MRSQKSGVRCRVSGVVAFAFLAAVWLGACHELQAAASVRSQIVWLDGTPQLKVTLDPGAASETWTNRTVALTIRAVTQKGYAAEGFQAGQTLKLTPDGKPVTATLPLMGGKGPLPPDLDYVRIGVKDDNLGLACEDLLYATKPGSLLQSYGVRLAGDFSNRTAVLALHFKPHGMKIDQTAACEFHLLDGEGNQVLSRTADVTLSDAQPTDYETDITPKRDTFGPYTLTFALNNETLGMALTGEARFPFATVLAPVSGMESDALADWHIPGRVSVPGSVAEYLRPKEPLDPQKLPGILFSQYQPFSSPAFDADVRHGGTRSLRIDYTPAAPVVIGSNVRLPGLPVVMRIWVKGNNTRDRLTVEWRDPCNFNAAAYERYMNTAVMDVCRLDFEGWKRFTVPVMGNGLLSRDTRSYRGGPSGQNIRHPIQTPLYLAAVRVIPEPPMKGAVAETAPRAVWIDDLSVETQAPTSERMALELRADTAERKLQAGAKLFVSVGNGTGYDIRNGRVAVTFLDAAGESVQELNEPVEVPAGEFATVALALDAVEARKPRGPVTALVTVTGPVAGQRVQGRLVFSRPTGGGLLWDFERAEHFNAQGPGLGSGAEPVAGGADGTGQALPLAVTTNRPVAVLLHPALPGLVESVEMQVFGEGTPVLLQPVFADSGSREFDLTYNQFATPPVRVDWKGWKTCRFPAPPLPAGYATAEGNPFYSPVYPLNLVLTARTEDGLPASIRVDQIRVSTHLSPRQERVAELDTPDETLLHQAGAPLRIVLNNFSSTAQTLDTRYRLTTPSGGVADEGSRKVTLPPGARVYVTLTGKLNEGFYRLHVDGLFDDRAFEADVLVPDRQRYFGDAPMTRLADLKAFDTELGLMQRRVNLDWDTAESVPGLFHDAWFRRYAARVSESNAYEVVPVVGYAADWAGPEKQPEIADGSYTRTVGNYMQAPVRLTDWDVFVHHIAREHARDFNTWVFWQNPDMRESPVSLEPEKYRRMFGMFHQWMALYNSNACVVAGGFNFDRVLNYLDGLKDPSTLPFDRFEVRVNAGGAPVDALQMEDFLEDLDAKLKLTETGRKAAIVELDWATGERLSLFDQAAYHARAAILLHARGALPHRFTSINPDETRDGFGILYRSRYGNSFAQPARPFYIPKPAYFALLETRKTLSGLEFLRRVTVADRDPLANRAYVFKRKDGGLCVAVWRVRGARAYRLPAEWAAAGATDTFGTPVRLDKILPLGPTPLFVMLPSVPVDQVAHALRNLQPLEDDAQHALVLDFRPAEAYSKQAADYTATGGDKVERCGGRMFTGERVSEGFLKNVTEERFAFTLTTGGDVLLSWLWNLGEGSRTAKVVLNGGPEQPWNLAPSEGLAPSNELDKVYVPGPKRSAYVLRGCRAGRNEVVLRHSGPATSGGFRLTRVSEGRVDLTDAGPLACVDSGAPAQVFRNAWGGPLTLGKQVYASGIGCMGQTLLEYPLNRQFSRFQVTVGIDAATQGKGTVGFKILVDGKEKAKSGPMTGMALPRTLTVDDLGKADRLLLVVDDGGDGSDNDLANWVEPVLYLKEEK